MKKILILLLTFFCFYGCKSINTESNTLANEQLINDIYAKIWAGQSGLYGYAIRQFCNDKPILQDSTNEIHALYENSGQNELVTYYGKEPEEGFFNKLHSWVFGSNYTKELKNLQQSNKGSTSYTYQILTRESSRDFIIKEYHFNPYKVNTISEFINTIKEEEKTVLMCMEIDTDDTSAGITLRTDILSGRKTWDDKKTFCKAYNDALNERFSSKKMDINSQVAEPIIVEVTTKKGNSVSTNKKAINSLKTRISYKGSYHDKTTYNDYASSYTVWIANGGDLDGIGLQSTYTNFYCSTGGQEITIPSNSTTTTDKIILDCKKVEDVTKTKHLKEVYLIVKE